MKVLLWMGGCFDRRTASEHLLISIVQALYARGHTVHIIQKDTDGPLHRLPKELTELGVTTDCIPCRLADKNKFFARYLIELRYVWQCRKYISQHKDCGAVFIQSNNTAGIVTYLVKRIIPKARLTYNVQDVFPENAACVGRTKGVVYKILSAEQKYAYRHADQIITISEDMKKLLIEKGAESEKTQVVYNWSYRDEPYRYEEVYHKEIADILCSDKFNVVYAGNIGIVQNVDIVVGAARILQEDSDIQFHVWGDGAYKERLQNSAKGLRNISFWPMLPSDLAPSIYAMADVNVIPLAPGIYRTALPSKTATCIACQKPIIFCFGEKSEFGQWVGSNEGCYVVDSSSEKELAEMICVIKAQKPAVHLEAMFRTYFSRTKNSQRYAALIAGD